MHVGIDRDGAVGIDIISKLLLIYGVILLLKLFILVKYTLYMHACSGVGTILNL